MPGANPYAPVIETGVQGSASAGPVSAAAGGRFAIGSPGAEHVSAALVLGALLLLYALWQSKFRFSMTVGGR